MFTAKRILFPTDYSACAEEAYNLATFLSKALGAELHILHVRADGATSAPSDLAVLSLSEAEVVEQLHMTRNRQAERFRRTEGVAVVIREVDDASPGLAIVGYCKEQDVDLVVMGTHGRCGFERFILGSVAEEVVRLAPCPVLTVHPGHGPAVGDRIRRILVPVDLSETSTILLEYACEVAAFWEAELDVVHVVERAGMGYGAGMEPFVITKEVALPIQLDALRLEALASSVLDERVKYTLSTRIGNPGNEIVEAVAESHSELIVMATHGWTGMRRMVLGSVTEKVVRHAGVPVLTFRCATASVTA